MKKKESLIEQGLLLLYTLILFVLNGIRIDDNNLWGDEAYSALLSRMSLVDMLTATAEDVHPPLYYIFVKIGRKLLGEHGWMFHLVSLIPYILVLILAVTIVRKLWSWIASAILVSFASLLPMAVNFNVEIRMYSWGSFFVFASFLALYGILKSEKTMWFAIFVAMSLCAAYTHYYCLISVAFFYIFLIAYVLSFKHKLIWKTVISCMLTVAIYMPWFIVLLKTFSRTSNSYWITEIPSFMDCCIYIFDGAYAYLYLVEFVVFILIFLVAKHKKCKIETIWFIAGFMALVGTMTVGIVVSKVVRPVFLVRYLYPVSIVAWTMLAVAVSQIAWKKWCGLLVVATILVGCVPAYQEVYKTDKYLAECVEQTLAQVDGQIQPGDVVISMNEHMAWTTAKYYFPGVETFWWTSELPSFERNDITYWMIFNEPPVEESVEWVRSQGMEFEAVVKQGHLGLQTVYIYRLYRV